MRTVFEDTEERANREDAKANDSGKHVPLFLWTFAIFFALGSYSLYHYAVNRKPPEPPKPPVNLADAKQIGDLVGQFNRHVQDGNWVEAEKMLSAEAQGRLLREGKSLQVSLLDKRANERVAEALPVPTSEGSTETQVAQMVAFKFMDGQFVYAPLTIIKEYEGELARLSINSWVEQAEPKPSPSPAVAAGAAATAGKK